MSKREFSLPGIDELNKDQKAVLRLKEHGQHLVVGGPGTGKSVVALLRVRKFCQNNNYVFLTFNHVLNSATKQICGIELNSTTAQSWFYDLQFRLATGNQYNEKKMPHLKDSNGRDIPHSPDYEMVIERFEHYLRANGGHFQESDTHIIIDEGQDLAVGFYEALQAIGFENFFIVADQNQQITNENSSRQELTDVLALENKDVIELKENYRNTSAIAKFARHFYTDKASPAPNIPDRPSLDTPTFYIYQTVNNCVALMKREAEKDTSKLIGVIVATDTKRDSYSKLLVKAMADSDMAVSTYSNVTRQAVNIDFSLGGFVVLCDKSVKGIEFDTVFIVLDDLKIINNDTDAVKKRLYVMTSRAKEKLFLLRSASIPNDVEHLLPTDNNLMIRDEI